jgi:hypothetical protein
MIANSSTQYFEYVSSSIEENASAKARKSSILWNENLETVLVNSVLKRKAYMKTKDNTLEAKWSLVQSDCVKHPFFVELVSKLTIEAVKKKFTRMRSTVEQNYALDGEGANLSGLPEHATSNEKCIFNMIVEEAQTKRSKDEDNAKKRQRNLKMLEHESKILPFTTNNLGKIESMTPTGSEDSDFLPSKRSSMSSSGRKSAEESQDEFLAKILTSESERMMSFQEEKHNMEERRIQRQLELEERRLALEEAKEKRESNNLTSSVGNELAAFATSIKNDMSALASVVSLLVDKVSNLEKRN